MSRRPSQLLLLLLAAFAAAGALSPVAGAAGPPVITSLDPSTGFTVGGDLVFVCGTGLDTVTGVLLDGTATDFTREDDDCLSVFTPAHAIGTVQVRLQYPGGVSADAGTADDFAFIAVCAPPTITSITPSSGPVFGGNTVVIRGTNLVGTLGVTFGFSLLADDLQVISDNELRVVAPAGPAPGRTDVAIINNCGASANTAADDYVYVQPVAEAPTVTSVSPSRSLLAGGDVVDLFGTGFDQSTVVRFGSTEGDVVSIVASTHLRVVVPPRAVAGKIDITAANAIGTSPNTAADDFTYALPLPTITKVSPQSGRVATGGVTLITGTNLSGVKAVRFGTRSARKIYAFPGFVIAVAPPQARGGYAVTVVTAAGTSVPTAASRYFYL